MIVVADTSPINYLIQIGEIELLSNLYERVMIPPAVLEELTHSGAPAAVRIWMVGHPAWMEVRLTSGEPDSALAFLDKGEREAIQLAEEHRANVLLVDDRRAQVEAVRRGLETTGTLGVLISADAQGLIRGEEAYHRLVTQTTFRKSDRLEAIFLKRLRSVPQVGE
jgi:predicted nucleic acid-binding protein